MKDFYRVLIVGNYIPEMSNVIRTAITQKLMRTKTLTYGIWKQVVVLQPIKTTALGALAGRIAKSLHYGSELFDPAAEIKPNLILAVHVSTKDLPEGLTEKLTDEYEKELEPYYDLDIKYQLVLALDPETLKAVITRPQPQPLPTPNLGDYGQFEQVKYFREEVVTEGPDTMDRTKIPNSVGVTPDMNKAGGLQQT